MDAVRAAALAAGFPELGGRPVFIKPNCLCARAPERAATTHPDVLRAVIRLCRERGAGKIVVGDSPAYQSSEHAATKAGLLAAAREEGAEWAGCAVPVAAGSPAARLVKSFDLAAEAVEGSPFLISLPKLKTHSFMSYSGAIKNLFGLVPGLRKAQFHFRFPERADFAAMLVDLMLTAAPSFAIMDAVVAMDGDGPLNGKPFPMGAVLASPSPLALDIAAARMAGFLPSAVPYLAEAIGRGLLPGDEGSIRYPMLPPGAAAARGFKAPRRQLDPGILRPYVPKRLYAWIQKVLVPRPWFRPALCALCGACAKICPAGALSIPPGTRPRGAAPSIERDKCILCYCCHEVCPEGAVRLSRFKPFH